MPTSASDDDEIIIRRANAEVRVPVLSKASLGVIDALRLCMAVFRVLLRP